MNVIMKGIKPIIQVWYALNIFFTITTTKKINDSINQTKKISFIPFLRFDPNITLRKTTPKKANSKASTNNPKACKYKMIIISHIDLQALLLLYKYTLSCNQPS